MPPFPALEMAKVSLFSVQFVWRGSGPNFCLQSKDGEASAVSLDIGVEMQ